MTTPYQIACCLDRDRPSWLRKAFFTGQQGFAAILFAYLVFDYKAKPNKKKAIFIYDKCIFADGDLGIHDGNAAATLDLHSLRDTLQPSADLKTSIQAVKAKRVEATAMNWFQRLLTSADRKAADIGLGASMFDEILTAHLDESGYNNIWADVMRHIENIQAPRSGDVYRSMKRCLRSTCDEIAGAGFSLEGLGLKAFGAALP